jgi:hypothetical protein
MLSRTSLAALTVIGVVLLSVTDVTAIVHRGRGGHGGAVGTPRGHGDPEVASFNLRGLGRLELGGGWRHHPANVESAVYVDDHLAASATDGAVGRIGFGYWTDDNVALTVDYTVHDVETFPRLDSYGYEYNQTTIVHSILFGLRYYLPRSQPYSSVLPYFSAGAGPFIGTAAWSEYDDCDCEEHIESNSTAVASARLGGGVDFMVGPRFMVGFNGGYNFVERFTEPIGGRYNYSGSDFGVSFSFLLGRGR